MLCPLCLRGLAQGVEQTQHFWHEPFLNLGDANTVSSRPGLWVPAKLCVVVTLLWGQSPGTVHRVPSEMLHGEWGLPDIWPSACIWTPFLFLIFIYLAVLGLMGSLVVACRLSWPIALGKCKANSQPLDLQGSPGWDFLACKTHSSSFQSFIFFTYRCISQLTRWFASRFSVLILRISNVDVSQSTEGSASRKSFFLSHYMYLLQTYAMDHQPALSLKELLYAEKKRPQRETGKGWNKTAHP